MKRAATTHNPTYISAQEADHAPRLHHHGLLLQRRPMRPLHEGRPFPIAVVMTVIDFDDQRTSRAELEEALASLVHRARREFAVVGTPLAPTPWDRRHASINALLDEWQGA